MRCRVSPAARAPATCLAATFRRFQTLMRAIWMMGRECRLVVVAPCLLPDDIGHRILPISEPGEGLSERQRDALGVNK
jgi:hypothetical protein